MKYVVKNKTVNQASTLVGHKSGSIFLCSKHKDGFYFTCLSVDRGEYHFGDILQSESLSQFKEMPKGFFIEIVRK